MVITYYIKLFRTGVSRHNGILMYLLLLVAETKIEAYQKKDAYILDRVNSHLLKTFLFELTKLTKLAFTCFLSIICLGKPYDFRFFKGYLW